MVLFRAPIGQSSSLQLKRTRVPENRDLGGAESISLFNEPSGALETLYRNEKTCSRCLNEDRFKKDQISHSDRSCKEGKTQKSLRKLQHTFMVGSHKPSTIEWI